MLTWTEIETRAAAFQKQWRAALGTEKQQDQKFIADFLSVFGVDWRTGFPQHQVFMPDGTPNYIDFLLPGQILIEMKSKGKSLDAAYTQALAYIKALKPEETPRLLMLSDFDQVRVYNLEKKQPFKPFKVNELRKHLRIFSRLAGFGVEAEDKTEIELNTDASYKMVRLHDALKEQNYTGHRLEVLLVRLLFCLFADDTGIFEKGSFKAYIQASNPDGSDLGNRLMTLFSILDQPKPQRMTNLSEALNRFRYIDGSLFSEAFSPVTFDAKMRTILLDCCEFDWTLISPAIFGAMFQGVMNPQERRELGAHYTSEENILKVIRPLFLDELEAEFERASSTTTELEAFLDKIASLTFLDPACGSGNFLIITYYRLRQLEFRVLKLLHSNLQNDFYTDHTRVSLHQFYGIEIEDFPCQIAKVSMLLMKHLCDQEISAYFGTNFIDFPIRDNANIVQGNALRMDWNAVVPAHKLSYIMGNPPFVGSSMMTAEQKNDAVSIFGKIKLSNSIDYVGAWYFLAAKMITTSKIRAAFVSTNSICQGEQVQPLWGTLLGKYDVQLQFAYRTFVWSNQARGQAAVFCVIVSIARPNNDEKRIYLPDGEFVSAHNINPYLVDSPNILISSRSSPISTVPKATLGNKPSDGGNLILSDQEYQEIFAKDPSIANYVLQYMGGEDFINNNKRYCFWLKDASPSWHTNRTIVERVRKVREFRLSSSAKPTREKANLPHEFFFSIQPDHQYLFIPGTSSERREYIPIGFLPPTIIASNSAYIIHSNDLYIFGVIQSSTHMAWMRTVAGRLKSDYRYSGVLVYNTFPWPEKTTESVACIEKAAQGVLDARANYPDRSYADLYDPLFMPPDLRKAHQVLDKEVFRAYGKDSTSWPSESAIVAALVELYQKAVKKFNTHMIGTEYV